jgi:hypothetical protein
VAILSIYTWDRNRYVFEHYDAIMRWQFSIYVLIEAEAKTAQVTAVVFNDK